jgi:hypothetical protein
MAVLQPRAIFGVDDALSLSQFRLELEHAAMQHRLCAENLQRGQRLDDRLADALSEHRGSGRSSQNWAKTFRALSGQRQGCAGYPAN